MLAGLQLQGVDEKKHHASSSETRVLGASQALLAALSRIGGAAIVCDESLRIIAMNAPAARWTQWSENEAQSRACSEVFRLETAPRAASHQSFDLSAAAKRAREGFSVALSPDTQLISRDGARYSIEGTMMPLHHDADSSSLFPATASTRSAPSPSLCGEEMPIVANGDTNDNAQIGGVMIIFRVLAESENVAPDENEARAVTPHEVTPREVTPREYSPQDEAPNLVSAPQSAPSAEARLDDMAPRIAAFSEREAVAFCEGEYSRESGGSAFAWLEEVHPNDRAAVRRLLKKALSSRGVQEFECRLPAQEAAGGWNFYHGAFVKLPATAQSGEAQWLAVLASGGERRRAEKLLAMQKRVLEGIATGVPLLESLGTLARFVEAGSAALCSILLLDEETNTLRHGAAPTLPAAYSRAVDGLVIGPNVESCGTAAYEKETVICEDIASDALWENGRELALSHNLRAAWAVPIYDANENVLGTFGLYYDTPRRPDAHEIHLVDTARDLAGIALERKRSEQNFIGALHQHERAAAELSGVLGQISDGVVLTDPRGFVTFANEAASALYGLPQPIEKETFAGVLFEAHSEGAPREYSLLSPEGAELQEHALPLFRALQEGATITGATWTIRRADRSEVIVEGSATPILATRGHSMGVAIILRDVTARRELMNQLVRVNAMKDDFLAVLSHELRTPLTPIMGWVALLRRAGRENAEVFEQALEAIERNTQVQKRLVDDLLDTTRIVSGKLLLEPSAFDLNWLLDGILQSAQRLAGERGIRIETELSGEVPPLFLDSERLQQVIINVLSNAVKFSEEGGVVHLRTRVQNAPGREYSRAVIEVEDAGCGIAVEVLPRIFERFYQGDNSMTRRHGGLGLGLSVSRTLVELHGGTIEVTSRGEEKGARVVITLPLRIEAPVIR